MEYGICPLSIVPVRSAPSDLSEMTSQLLFGEVFEVLSVKPKWIKIRCTLDGYEGWISANQSKELSAKEYTAAQKNCSFCLELVQGAMTNNHYVPITLGCTLPEYDGLNLKLDGQKFTYSGQVINPLETKPDSELLIKIARKYLYAPYLWGGRSPFGIDCSGFVQVVFKMLGYQLARDSSKQVEHGDVVNFIEEAIPGDLAFFEDKKGKIVHVGFILQEQQILHASGKVRIDKLDHQGIYNEELGKYSHKLRIIKRILQE